MIVSKLILKLVNSLKKFKYRTCTLLKLIIIKIIKKILLKISDVWPPYICNKPVSNSFSDFYIHVLFNLGFPNSKN